MMAFSLALHAQIKTEHVVQKGETIESIAAKYGVTVDELKRINQKAAKFLYAGMKLVIPQRSVVEQTNDVQKDQQISRTVTDSLPTPIPTPTPTQNNRSMQTVWGFEYVASSFNDVKSSGHYGMLLEFYDINGSGLGFGGLLFGFDYGLVDKEYTNCFMQIGPNYSVSLGNSQNARLIVPVYVYCMAVFSDAYKQYTGKSSLWGWSINPKVQYGILQIGFTITGGFQSGSKVSAGFSAGLVF